MGEVIIVGNGPAGISAALYTARAGIRTTVIGKDGGSLSKAEKIENYYGLKESISGNELIDIGISQAKKVGVEFLFEEVVGIGYSGKLKVKTKSSVYEADGVILATGTSRSEPKTQGIREYEGKGISYCAVCDAFFHKGRDVAVYGSGEYALSEARELLPIVKSVTLITDGENPVGGIQKEIRVVKKKISEFTGEDGILKGVRFDDDTTLSVSGIFVALGVAGSTDLAKKIGAQTKDKKIIVNDNMETNLPGLYGAGDCTGGMYQIAKAVYEGAKAGTEAVKYIREKNGQNIQ